MPRAQRFSLQLPVQYRRLGEGEWHAGTTQNVSRSGMLFRGSLQLPVKETVELRLVLPVEVAGRPGATVLCRGEVVRSEATPKPEDASRVAVNILDFRFLPEPGNG